VCDGQAGTLSVISLADMDTLEVRQRKDKETYYRLLLNLLAEEVRRFFKRNDQEPSPRVAELVRHLDGR
jgi:predicted house-cleaning noncanonical NTP pyrophosphatase (MazG superfamily)